MYYPPSEQTFAAGCLNMSKSGPMSTNDRKITKSTLIACAVQASNARPLAPAPLARRPSECYSAFAGAGARVRGFVHQRRPTKEGIEKEITERGLIDTLIARSQTLQRR